MLFSAFQPGDLISGAGAYMAVQRFDKAIVVTRVNVYVKVAPLTCTPNAQISVTDLTNAVTVTVTTNDNDSGTVSQAYAAGAPIYIGFTTYAASCGISPANANITVQYRMQ